jgi:hypothetical protein
MVGEDVQDVRRHIGQVVVAESERIESVGGGWVADGLRRLQR